LVSQSKSAFNILNSPFEVNRSYVLSVEVVVTTTLEEQPIFEGFIGIDRKPSKVEKLNEEIIALLGNDYIVPKRIRITIRETKSATSTPS
jgi:hypothetical protein